MKSDIELLHEFKKGNPRAFDQLVLRHQKTIYFLALRLLGNEVEAQDLAQNTFVQVFRNAHRFKGKSEFKTWVFRIAVNLSKNHLRGRSRKNETDLDGLELVSPSNPLSSVVSREEERELFRLVNRLPRKQRITLILRIYKGFSYAEISSVLGCPVGTAKANFHQAIKKLKSVLTPKGENL
ncbi:MAG: sigma-70 family RNA polymerase sigma factor [Thermodesulfobacteriota bacterium]|nr:sigma-70 family RNA polymerase sigma factor [Thermodesulfobacteriota bacterium]